MRGFMGYKCGKGRADGVILTNKINHEIYIDKEKERVMI